MRPHVGQGALACLLSAMSHPAAAAARRTFPDTNAHTWTLSRRPYQNGGQRQARPSLLRLQIQLFPHGNLSCMRRVTGRGRRDRAGRCSCRLRARGRRAENGTTRRGAALAASNVRGFSASISACFTASARATSLRWELSTIQMATCGKMPTRPSTTSSRSRREGLAQAAMVQGQKFGTPPTISSRRIENGVTRAEGSVVEAVRSAAARRGRRAALGARFPRC